MDVTSGHELPRAPRNGDGIPAGSVWTERVLLVDAVVADLQGQYRPVPAAADAGNVCVDARFDPVCATDAPERSLRPRAVVRLEG